MTKRTFTGLVAIVAGLALLAGGVATASNMGFKFVPQIPGASGNNALNLSLPWNNNYTNAKSLFDDLNGQTPGIVKVSQFTTGSKFLSWAGSGGGTNFSIVKGSAYVVYGSGAGQTPVVVGSHDPNFTFTFTASQAYNAAAPYHQTLTNAKGIYDNLTTACGAGKVAKVSKITAGSKLLSWAGTGGGTNFNLDLGMGVVVYTSANCSGYVWPHY